MERKEAMLKTGYSTLFLAVMAVFLCAAPCGAQFIESGETFNVGTGYTPEQILGDGLVVKGNGTLNMCPGAYVDSGIIALAGSTVNIWGGTFGPGRYVTVVPQTPIPTVTVYGPAFEDSVGPITTTQWTPAGGVDTLIVTDEDGVPIFSLLFYSDNPIYLDSTGTPPPPPPSTTITVDIDIKPGSDPNPINPGSNGVIPVAILTTDTFDASTVDPGTVTLAGAEVAVRGKSEKTMARLEDVDGDGDNDLLLQVETESWAELWEGGEVILTGKTYDGEDIKGTDEVIIVPPE